MSDDRERLARAALSRLGEPDDKELGASVLDLGAVEVLRALRAGTLPGEGLRRRLSARLDRLDVDADLRALDRVGGRLLCPGDDEWPSPVDYLGERRPLALWARGAGHLGELSARAVAIVGARAMTEYGEHVAVGLGADLAERGWTVVSGGAFGIDSAAHRGALAAAGSTVAVLACGVDMDYPRDHAGLLAEIRRTGVVVSELPPGSAPFKARFLSRNRLIAALAAGTVLVEAAIRSGARRTAGECMRLHRPLMVVPGPVNSELSAGCHVLLRDFPEETVLVTCTAEVVEVVGKIGADLAPVRRGEVLRRDRLTPDVARVLDAVPVRRGRGPARIAGTAGLPLPMVERALGELELHGLVEETSEGWRLAAARASGA